MTPDAPGDSHRVFAYGYDALLVEFAASAIAADPLLPARLEALLLSPAHDHRGEIPADAPIGELVTSDASLLIRLSNPADGTATSQVEDMVHRAIADLRDRPPTSQDLRPAATEPVVIPVSYAGVDLDEVAHACDMSVTELIAVHTATDFTVAFCGFAPGFAYLTGLPPALRIPRRDTPRPRVPAGSVAIAEHYAAVYPRSSPGGWHLIGHTDRVLFDPSHDQPALLTPGASVRFTAARERIDVIAPEPIESVEPDEPVDPALRVLDPGPQCLIEDLGRPGWHHLAVSASGAWDRSSHRLAQRLVGNSEASAGLECVSGGLQLQALRSAVIAITGGAGPAWIIREGASIPVSTCTPIHLAAGDELRLGVAEHGLRRYVAVRGGIDAVGVLGSRSTDTLSALGPPPVTSSMGLSLGTPAADVPASDIPAMTGVRTDGEVIPTPLWELIRPSSRERLASGEFHVDATSSRVGVRLWGAPLEWSSQPDSRRSRPMVRGAIQVPPDGQPVILGPDHPATGGYPVIGVLADPDLVAQWAPGVTVRLREVVPFLLAPRAASSTGRAADS